MISTALPIRADSGIGMIATVGLLVAAERTGSDWGVWFDDRNRCHINQPLADVAAVLTEQDDVLWGVWRGLSTKECPARAKPDRWHAMVDDPELGELYRAWTNPYATPVRHPFAGGLGFNGAFTIVGLVNTCTKLIDDSGLASDSHCSEAGGWEQALTTPGITKPVSSAATQGAVGWDGALMRRSGRLPRAVFRPALEMLAVLGILALPHLPGIPPPGWITGKVDGTDVLAWCWPSWSEPLNLAGALHLFHGRWGWEITTGPTVTAKKTPAAPVTGLWASVMERHQISQASGGTVFGPAFRVR